MAQRRMISKAVINTAKFLKMPVSSQLLYFHLILNADDDGVAEAFSVMRLLGCAEDDLRVLMNKDFVHVLNEDLVTFILDWREHNNIRADRKIDSMYQDLLVQVFPDIKLLESKQRADSKQFKPVPSSGRPVDRVGDQADFVIR